MKIKFFYGLILILTSLSLGAEPAESSLPRPKLVVGIVVDQMRWDYLYVKSSGHNTVIVDGEEQVSGKHKDQPWQPGVGGRIEKFVTGPAFDYVVMDATKAYPGEKLKSWKRTVILDKSSIEMDREIVYFSSSSIASAREYRAMRSAVPVFSESEFST